MKNTKEDIIISEFMSLVFIDDSNQYYDTEAGLNMGVKLNYSTDWNWLIEVIEKIDRTDTLSSIEEPYWYCVSLNGNYATVKDGKTGEIIIEIKQEDEYTWIDTAYKLALEFVKWYKSNKK